MRIIIRAVPGEREEHVVYLLNHLPDHVEVLYDRTRNAMITFLAAMEMAGDDPCVHLEDDVVLTKDFYPKLLNVIPSRPSNIIQFFSMREMDRVGGSRWDTNFSMNQCTYLPRMYSRMILEYYPEWEGKKKNPTAYDYLINDWLKTRQERYWLHVPSLVDHRVAKSLINPRRSSKRQSLTFEDPV